MLNSIMLLAGLDETRDGIVIRNLEKLEASRPPRKGARVAIGLGACEDGIVSARELLEKMGLPSSHVAAHRDKIESSSN